MTWATPMRKTTALLAATAALLLALIGASSARAGSEVLFVGNNWEGTADVLQFDTPGAATGNALAAKAHSKCRRAKKHGKASKRKCGKARRKHRRAAAGRADGPVSLKRIGRLNIIPDFNQRMLEILLNPVRLAYFLAIQQLVGEGHNQYVDDMYSSNDGKLLIVSRPSFADVVAIRISTGEIVWRFKVAGQRADHMGLSPDGKRVAVSASTGNVVHILDVETGQQVGQFESGDSPHENTYSRDGNRIYHASIGLVYTPLDQPALDTTKGKRYFQVVDAHTYQIISRVDMGQKLAEAGYPGMSSAVRPMAISPDERFAYLQVSFFHGFVEYDLVNQRVTRVTQLPITDPSMPREQYVLDSAHHGIAINGAGSTLCVAGTMDDYAAIVDRQNFSDYTILRAGQKPYWATSSDDGRYCYMSWSGTDKVSVFSYADRTEVAKIQVGRHPQRIRTGHLSSAARQALAATAP